MNVRKLALELLSEYEASGKYVNLSLSSHKADKLSREDRASLTALLYTTVERKLTYDYYISSLSSRKIDELDSYTLNLLRLGLCQIADMRSIPSYAAVNETVKLARNPGERSFVNAVLRAAVRSEQALPLPKEEKNYRRYLSVKYSFPLPTVKLFDSLYGREGTERLLSFFNDEKYTDLTVNTNRISVDDFLLRLAAFGVKAEKALDSHISVRINGSVNPEQLSGFAEGHFFVQDRASAIAAAALGPKKGDTVIDVCACPGGKSFAAAILMENSGSVYSFDIHGSKLSLINGGAERLGLSVISSDECDAASPKQELFGTADKVICDVPCSGLGVLGKKPDLRYKSMDSIKTLPDLQLSILQESVKYLKVGGELLYSTCTLNPEENEDVVREFLSSNPQYSSTDFKVGGLTSDSGSLKLIPHIHHTDGFFMAKIKKEKQ